MQKEFVRAPTKDVERWVVRSWSDGNFELETRRRENDQDREQNARAKLQNTARGLDLPVAWNCYFDKCDKCPGAPTFPASLNLLGKVATVSMLWQLQDGYPKPSQLMDLCVGSRASCGYYFFRDPVPPIWEDERHRGGGKLLVGGVESALSKLSLDELWRRIVLCCAGGDSRSADFPEAVDFVLGCTLTVKKDSWKVSVWIPKCTPADVRKLLAWLAILYDVDPRRVTFLPHRTKVDSSVVSPPKATRPEEGHPTAFGIRREENGGDRFEGGWNHRRSPRQRLRRRDRQ